MRHPNPSQINNGGDPSKFIINPSEQLPKVAGAVSNINNTLE